MSENRVIELSDGFGGFVVVAFALYLALGIAAVVTLDRIADAQERAHPAEKGGAK